MKYRICLLVMLASNLSITERSLAQSESVRTDITTLCKPGSLPPEIQNRLKQDFGSWKVQQSEDLGSAARQRWESEKPMQCPGIEIGKFESARTISYALLLTSKDHGQGYKIVAFIHKDGSSYDMRMVEESNDGQSGSFFIHKVPITKLFNEQSRKKFHVLAREGILLVDAAENEYEADVYFWTKNGYRHEPVDY